MSKKRSLIFALVLIATILTFIFGSSFFIPYLHYQDAMELYKQKKYEQSEVAFSKLKDYKDSPNMVLKSRYHQAQMLFHKKEFEKAIAAFTDLKKFEDSPNMVLESKYYYALELLKAKNYQDAYKIFKELENYRDSKEVIREVLYSLGKQNLDNKNFQSAIEMFKKVNNYKDSDKLLQKSIYLEGTNLFTNGDFNGAKRNFSEIKEYSDSKNYLNKISYLEKYQGTWESESGFSQKIFRGWEVSSVYFPHSSDTKVYTFEYHLDGKKLKSYGDTFSLDQSNNLLYDDEIYKKVSDSTIPPLVIQKEEPRIGMMADEVRNSSWGYPQKINKTTTKYGVSEQWVYSGYKYIYLDDGIVTAIQE